MRCSYWEAWDRRDRVQETAVSLESGQDCLLAAGCKAFWPGTLLLLSIPLN
jgi:hypothetical protein